MQRNSNTLSAVKKTIERCDFAMNFRIFKKSAVILSNFNYDFLTVLKKQGNKKVSDESRNEGFLSLYSR